MERQIAFLGDIHGAFRRLITRMEVKGIENVDIVQVGDFGLGFNSVSEDRVAMKELDKFLESKNCTLTAFRGNHDKPSMFESDPFGLSNVRIMPDNSIVELCGKKILLVGGAISIDRKYRQEMIPKWGVTCWPDGEKFVFDKEKLDALDLSEVDILCTHSSPKFTHPMSFSQIVYDFADQDPGLLRDLEIERELITEFYDYIKPKMPKLKNYFYGHFHQSWNSEIDGVNFRLLGVDELYELK